MLQHSAKAIIIAGLALQPLTHQPTGTQWRKTPLHILSLSLQDMGVKEYLFAPRRRLVLTIGWWLISLVSQRIESRVLVDLASSNRSQ